MFSLRIVVFKMSWFKILNVKELSLCHKIRIYNLYIFGTQCRKSLIFQTYIIWSNKIHSLKYLRSMTLESKEIGFRKAEFMAKTQFLWKYRMFLLVFFRFSQFFYNLSQNLIILLIFPTFLDIYLVLAIFSQF